MPWQNGLQFDSNGNLLVTPISQVLKNRIGLFGDSIAQFNLYYNNLPTTAGSYVVANGIATCTFSANIAPIPGNYVSINNVADPTMGHPDNGRFVQVLTGSSPTTSVATFTFASNAAAGDYSNYLGGIWNVCGVIASADGGLLTWINALSRGQFIVTANFSCVGENSTQTLAVVKKFVAAPNIPIDIAYLVVDAINDTQQGFSVSTSVSNYIQSIQLLQSAGYKVWVQTGNGINLATGSGFQANNNFLQAVAKQLRQYCKKNSGVVLFDTYKEWIAGQYTGTTIVGNGYSAANSIGRFIGSDGVHPNSNGCLTAARNQFGVLNGVYAPIEDVLFTLLDDSVNFPLAGNVYQNLLPNGGMLGNGGAVGGSPTPTGTVANSWGVASQGTPTSVTCTAGASATTGFTPTQIGTSNSENYGYAQRIQCATSAAGQGFELHNFNGNVGGATFPNWFQFGSRVYVRANSVSAGGVYGLISIGPSNFFMNGNGSTDVGIGLLAGDTLWMQSGPLYLPSAPSFLQFFNRYYSVTGASGAVDLEFSAAFIRQIDNLYV